MKKTAIVVFTFIFLHLPLVSVPKAEEPEGKKEVQAQKEKLEPNLLTEKEQEELEEFGGNFVSPNKFESEQEAIKYLRILLKGDHKTIRWYQRAKRPGLTDKYMREMYGADIGTALIRINTKKREGFNLAVEVLKTKSEYPEAMATAAWAVGFAHDPSVIPLLREVVKHPVPFVRLDAAGSLLNLGDADTALPILDELVEKEDNLRALNYLFKWSEGEIVGIIDERGYEILEKALKHPRAQMKLLAVDMLLKTNKIPREKAERIALGMLEKFKDKRSEDYGIGIDKDPKHGLYYVLSGYEAKSLNELEKPYHSDSNACEYAVSILRSLKSKKAIPLLKYIHERNTNIGCVCHENLSGGGMAANALKEILDSNNDK